MKDSVTPEVRDVAIEVKESLTPEILEEFMKHFVDPRPSILGVFGVEDSITGETTNKRLLCLAFGNIHYSEAQEHFEEPSIEDHKDTEE